MVVVIAKSVVFAIELALTQPLTKFAQLILGWIEAYPTLELIVVIVIVPVVMNGLAFWVQDNFIMKKEKDEEEAVLLDEKNKNK